MKLKKALLASALLVCLSIGYYGMSNAGVLTQEQKRETYDRVRSEFVQEQEAYKKQSLENPNDPQLERKLKELKDKASKVNTLAREVDADAYYKNELRTFIAALEGTIDEETRHLAQSQSPFGSNTTEKLRKVVEEKKALLEECKKIDIENEKNPKQLYEELSARVIKITSQMAD